MKFINLTCLDAFGDAFEVSANVEKISYLHSFNFKDYKANTFIGIGDAHFEVRETVDQIKAMIEKAQS